MSSAPRLDVLIPVYEEGESIHGVLDHLQARVRTPFRALLCYDHDSDSTLAAVRSRAGRGPEVVPVKNEGRGVHGAVLTGFRRSSAPAVLVYPADDDANGGIVDELVRRFESGCALVAPSRFMKGGCMVGCRWQKAALVRTAAFTLRCLARIPTHDPTNGFRLFSRRLLESVRIESTDGFAFSIELLAKCHRLGWKIDEVPSSWFERKRGKSRFRILKWLPVYLRWYFYILATAYLGRRSVAAAAAPAPRAS